MNGVEGNHLTDVSCGFDDLRWSVRGCGVRSSRFFTVRSYFNLYFDSNRVEIFDDLYFISTGLVESGI